MKQTIHLGLDIGTNSIGWALIDVLNNETVALGCRIIPMTQDTLSDFDEGKGNKISQTAERTQYRTIRKLRQRQLLRRERLHRILHLLGWLPQHYTKGIDFEKGYGKFLPGYENKLAYSKEDDTQKHTFYFHKAFEEMLADFKLRQADLLNRKNGKGEAAKVPYDWTIYYLRKKALTQKLEKEELAWVLLQFNQKRGYLHQRGEETEEKPNKLEEIHTLKIVAVSQDEEPNKKGEIWYKLHLENGWIYRRPSKKSLDNWKGTTRDFIVTTEIDPDDGSIKLDKDGNEKRSFSAPKEDDWTLRKKKTEKDLTNSGKTVGAFIYDALLQNPNEKIKGNFIRTIDRKNYEDELQQILATQKKFHPELNSDETVGKQLLQQAIMELYPHNIARQNELQKKDIAYLLHRDILFYQRDLKSKKSSIGNCPLEIRYFEKDGETQTQAVKCIPKSHPLYQELRLWQWISNLRIYSNKDIQNEKPLFLETMQDRADLYDYLSAKKSIKQNDLLQHLLEHKQNLSPKEAKKQAKNYHWNYPTGDKNDKEYPCAETVSLIHRRLEKVYNCPDDFLTQEKLIALWHLIYSVRKGNEYEKALKTFARKNGLHIDSFTEAFKNFPAFSGTYGAYSEKAVKKLLALMRCGKYWNANDIDEHTRTRIQKLIDDGEMDENISLQTRNATEGFSQIEDFQGMPEYAAKYVVYNRHAETSYNEKWHSPADIERFLHEFRQHSLRNPIVEQVVLETLRTVKELWQQYGKDENDFFAAIHVELARELKKNKSERNEISNNQSKNEATNQRIRALLAVLGNDTSIENVIPYSPNQQDILKLYEEGALMATENIPADIAKIATTAAPTHKELLRYKLWLDQKYRSPYTNKIIPLSRLFTRDYEIEHIIPQSRYFDDSFNNKVICETEVNRLKGKQLALEFIRNPEKRKIIINGKEVIILDEEKYTQNVNKNFAGNKGKLKRLLMDEIPAKMIERQMNDTRYISKFVAQQLAKIVPLHENDDPMHERKNNVIITSGSITARLRNDWGLNNIWNKLMLPRFERMNELSNTTDFTYFNENHQKLIPTVPDQYRHKFQKKRIDHRHHALDALVVACTSRNMVNYLNNQSGLDEAMKQNKKLGKEDRQKARHDLRDKLCYKKDHDWFFNTPWVGFAKEAEAQLKNVVVSFKQNTRVLTMATNLYQKYVRQADGSWKKESVKQTKGDRLAIRKPLHQETVFGEVLLQKIQSLPLADALQNINNIADKQLRREIRHRLAQNHSLEDIVAQFKKEKYLWKGKKINKIDIYTYDTDAQGKPNMVAVRKALDDTFDANKIANITDTGIQKILLRHLENYHNDPKEAFSPEGIEAMNQQLPTLNNGKDHKPIYKVRLAEVKGAKFAIGQTGNKKDKYVVAAKGTNLYFAIYQTEAGERKYSSPPLNEVIERLKQKLPPVPTQDENGNPLLFYLSPNELVYVPTPEEQQTPHLVDFARLRPEQVQRIYKMVSCTNTQCMFIKQEVATSIVDKMEFSSLNKMEKDIEGNMIKHCCWKLHVTRLGIITKVEQ